MTIEPIPPAIAGPGRWKIGIARLGRILVAAVFLLAAGPKALDPESFAAQIGTFDWLPAAWNQPAAIFFVTLEFLLAAALLVDFRPRLASVGTTALLLVFLVVLTEAWYNGNIVDCGCFGDLSSAGPGTAAWRDVGFLALLVPTFFWGARPRPGRWKPGVVAGSVLLGAGLSFAAPSLPLDDLLTKLVPGADLEAMGMDALVPEVGPVLVALLDLETEAGQEVVAVLNDMTLDFLEVGVDVMGLAAADPDVRFVFTMEHSVGFRLEEIGAGTLDSLARRLPRFALLVDGTVVAVWNEQPPAPDDVRALLEGEMS